MPSTNRRRVRRSSISAQPSNQGTNGNTLSGYRNSTLPQYTKNAETGKCIFDCPVCGGPGQLTIEPRRDGRGWWVNCWKAKCKTQGEYLTALADALGYPGHGGNLKTDPLRYLGEPIAQGTTEGKPARLPSGGDVAGWISRLWSDRDEYAPLDYLRMTRGLADDTIRHLGMLGYDGRAFTIPILDATGELVNLRRRFWPNAKAGKKYVGLKGRTKANGGLQLYPQPLPGTGWLLVEGEFDALIGRQHGLPAVTGTMGTSWWAEGWDGLVRGRRVAVLYDVGAEAAMHKRVAGLRAAGAEAWPVRLSLLLDKGKDLTDALTGGCTAQDVLDLVDQERPARRIVKRKRRVAA
jgi:hypothetical protein